MIDRNAKDNKSAGGGPPRPESDIPTAETRPDMWQSMKTAFKIIGGLMLLGLLAGGTTSGAIAVGTVIGLLVGLGEGQEKNSAP